VANQAAAKELSVSLRILVVGAGAVGGYFGARLAQAGRDVTFLVRRNRAEALGRTGLQVESPLGDFTVQPNLVTADQLNSAYDVVLVSLKGYSLAAALDDFAPAVGDQTLILPVLNGMRHMELLATRLSEARLLGGVCVIAAVLEDGKVRQLAPMQQIRYGELDGAVTDRIRALDAAMQGVGFDAAISTHIVEDMWDKWVLLASLGAATCLLGGSVGAIAAVPDGVAVARSILQACCGIAAAWGHEPSAAFRAQALATITQAGSPLTSSMYRDMQAGVDVEVEPILGDLIARGRKRGIDAALLDAAAVRLRVYAAARSKG
jgi:2-dehydropantoate 2-reductase